MKIGIIGLPNAGKSTIFNALAGTRVEAARHPFTTIEPNVGMARLDDPRLLELVKIFQPKKTVAAAIKFVDVAGLVEGASRGEGLGNQFLAAIRETSALVHAVRCFSDPDTAHVFDTVDPVRDVEVIRTELFLSDLEQVERKLERINRGRTSGLDHEEEAALLLKGAELLKAGDEWRGTETAARFFSMLPDLPLLTLKPVVYLANCGEDDPAGTGTAAEKLRDLASANSAGLISFCGKLEAEIMNLPVEDRIDFREAMGLKEPELPRLVSEAKKLLGLITFFTKEGDEVRAWMAPEGTAAAAAAGMIHTDMEKGFIKAEVAAFEDLKDAGSIGALKDTGRLRLEGRDYPVREGDVIRFHFKNITT